MLLKFPVFFKWEVELWSYSHFKMELNAAEKQQKLLVFTPCKYFVRVREGKLSQGWIHCHSSDVSQLYAKTC